MKPKFTPPVSFEEASAKAELILSEMTIDEKIEYIGGHNYFFIKGAEKHNIPRLYLADATQGVHLRKDLDGQLEKSTAFPAPIALVASWNTELAYKYAEAVGRECRAGDIAVLLGPGMNIYRNSQNGRNFEYFGEDPFLAARFIENYAVGMQETGTIATLKHFVCNNTDYYRRTSNSVVDERSMHEIYLPAFKAGIDAGAMAIMTSYNQVNGEWAGQSKYVITDVLRKQLGFKWLVMTDWWSIWDPEKAIASGLDLEMPGHGRKSAEDFEDFGNPFLRSRAKQLLAENKASEENIHAMAKRILSTAIAMGLDQRPVKDESFLSHIPAHKEIALQTAREGIVLLKNDKQILPIEPSKATNILLTGIFTEKIVKGKGAAEVEGYDNISLKDALIAEFGDALIHRTQPTDKDFSMAEAVFLSAGTEDSEGWDSPFTMPEKTINLIKRATALNPNVIVLLNSGRGVEMESWIGETAALLYCWYPGQIGNQAVAEILSGKINPSGKLPFTIERKFEDSPAYPYISEDRGFYEGWDNDFKIDLPILDVHYNEGVFVGYRWFEQQKIEPLFPFGFGLSYSQFSYSDLRLSSSQMKTDGEILVSFRVKNCSSKDGAEICQLYVKDNEASVPRPEKELKGFKRISLQAGEEQKLSIALTAEELSFYDAESHAWKAEAGEFTVLVGGASNSISLSAKFSLAL